MESLPELPDDPRPADSLTDRVRAFAERAAVGSDLYVVDVQVRGQKGAHQVNVFIDTDAGVGVDEIARYSRELGFVLETDEVMPGRYFLNVSSPGADRPLALPRQFPRHVGRKLRVVERAGTPDGPDVTLEGTLTAADASALMLELGTGEERRVAFDDVVTARVLLPW